MPVGKDGGNGRNGGWLSDLLTRASRDDSPPIAPPGPRARRATASRSLESLSVDIARMIDHDAAAELWERYKRGERNGLFSRRLYTAQGQKAFEEIRRKYRGDAEFRQTVEQYIHEFERLHRRCVAWRTRRGGGAQLSHVRHRQGLHHAGARRRDGSSNRRVRRAERAPHRPSAFCRNGRRTAHSPASRAACARGRVAPGTGRIRAPAALPAAVIAALPFAA